MAMRTNARLGAVSVGDGFPVRMMAAINVSPESFYKGSVANTGGEIAAHARRAIEEGADLIDIGGASTAPYVRGEVSEEVETSRVREALRAVVEEIGGGGRGGGEGKTAISVDTVRSRVADMALRDGASVINDVSGLKNDPAMARVVRDRGASLLAMAHSSRGSTSRPIEQISRALDQTLAIAGRAGLEEDRIVLDPGIGFFRNDADGKISSPQKLMPWYEWDCEVVADLKRLKRLGRPIGIGMSRKSFLGKILELESPEERLAGSLGVTAIAVTNGANLIRTHDVKETLQAVRVAEAVRKARHPRAGRLS
jgi:dihydropteroate synthase